MTEPTSEESALKFAAELGAEAKIILNSLINVPEGYSNEGVDRFVDCVIASAVWVVSDMLRNIEKNRADYRSDSGKVSVRKREKKIIADCETKA